MTHHVIIGAGEAGLRAAAALRDAGERHVTLVGGEHMPSYDRPALSKPDGETGLFIARSRSTLPDWRSCSGEPRRGSTGKRKRSS